jgi:hypothetical protein
MLERLGIPDAKRRTLQHESLDLFMTHYTKALDRTVCPKGHDLTVPGRRRVYEHRKKVMVKCKVCVDENNARQKAKRQFKSKLRECAHCGMAFLAYARATTCSRKCTYGLRRKTFQATPKQKPMRSGSQMEQDEMRRAAALLELYEARDRCSTHWERAEMDAKIQALKTGHN